MVYDDLDEIINLELAQKAYEKLERLDAVILGMGDDGHTASIFPNDPESEIAVNTQELIVSTKAPNFPTNRITCSLKFLQGAKRTFLFFTGENKLKVLNDSVAKKYPIAHFYNPNTDIYYAN